MNNDRAGAETALKIDSDKRYAVMGFALLAKELGVSPQDEKTLAETGKLWFQNNLNSWRELICNHERLRSWKEAIAESEEVVVCLAIADLILGSVGSVPAVTVSAQLMRIGLEKLCNDIR
jgi:hypothetical protein